MKPTHKPKAVDQAERDAAVAERSLNVLIDAGAGTGKTSTLVARIIALVAPMDDRATPMRMDRVAAVTFTRRAAGELKLRLRERLLAELSASGVSVARASRLRNALGALDIAYVGTIHSFADRLLRLHPVEAALSPAYTIAEDDDALVRETFNLLFAASESGTLASELVGTPVRARAPEAERTVLECVGAGLRAESQELEFMTRYGLDAVIAAFLRQRDVAPREPRARDFDAAVFDRAASELRTLVQPLSGTSLGARWLRGLANLLDRAGKTREPAELYAALYPGLHSLKSPTLGDTFEGDGDAWHVWKLLTVGTSKKVTRLAPLRDEILAPLQRWLATRLVRLHPVVVALYRKVKARHQAVDSVDLLLQLRDLLARDLQVRGAYQALFDHVFVDEFQDTDPLQAEVLLFLCEKTPLAASAADVKLAEGRLTLVGDPKQSIYRFRRADIAMYESVRLKVASARHRAIALSANFRSTPPLIEWFNDRFAALLGPPPPKGQAAFSPVTGDVAYSPLKRGRSDGQSVAIHVVPFEPADPKPNAAEYRDLEAEVLARYLRWLVERSDFEVLDPVTRKRRAVTFADVAVLAFETSNLPRLFPELDAMGIPHAARGGTLFLSDPLHRQFLLGLRAIADRDDGVAQAALFRAPFFAIDVSDLIAKTERANAALELVQSLRARRLARSPGETARDLLEHTAFGRHVSLGPNGLQRLERLRELCWVLEQTAAEHGLDFDGATARLRDWVNAPIGLDPPHPVGAEALQIMTVHQAKGLEFPVVVLWDGRAGMRGRAATGPWHVTRDGASWQLSIDKLDWGVPPFATLAQTEKTFADAERKRLVYVAATRARDLLVVPKAGTPGSTHVAGMLLAGGHGPMALELETYRPGRTPTWAKGIKPPVPKHAKPSANDEERIAQAWASSLQEASRSKLRPRGVASAAHEATQRAASNGEASEIPRNPGRYGPVFGDTVHRAIGIALASPNLSSGQAVARAARITGLRDRLAEAAADVARALSVLAREGLTCAAELRIEYPVAGSSADGALLGGYIDLIAADDEIVSVVDFKTDRSLDARSPEESFPAYVLQLDGYLRLLRQAGIGEARRMRAGLLFTDQGTLHWIDAPSSHEGVECS